MAPHGEGAIINAGVRHNQASGANLFGKTVMAIAEQVIEESKPVDTPDVLPVSGSLSPGQLKELVLRLDGEGHVTGVEGAGLMHWGIRRGTNDQRSLVLHTQKASWPQTNWTFTVQSAWAITNLPANCSKVPIMSWRHTRTTSATSANASKSVHVWATTGRPATSRKSLSPPAPIRVPRPAATMTTEFMPAL